MIDELSEMNPLISLVLKVSRNKNNQTLTSPPMPQETAITSPQYRSLHQLIHHPPSASRFPDPGLLPDPALVPKPAPCCCIKACATSDAEAPSSVGPAAALVCVGVNATETAVGEEGDGPVGRIDTSISSVSCHVARDGCSRHSYIRSWLSVDIEAWRGVSV